MFKNKKVLSLMALLTLSACQPVIAMQQILQTLKSGYNNAKSYITTENALLAVAIIGLRKGLLAPRLKLMNLNSQFTRLRLGLCAGLVAKGIANCITSIIQPSLDQSIRNKPFEVKQIITVNAQDNEPAKETITKFETWPPSIRVAAFAVGVPSLVIAATLGVTCAYLAGETSGCVTRISFMMAGSALKHLSRAMQSTSLNT